VFYNHSKVDVATGGYRELSKHALVSCIDEGGGACCGIVIANMQIVNEHGRKTEVTIDELYALYGTLGIQNVNDGEPRSLLLRLSTTDAHRDLPAGVGL
jgi:hypothetical protein